MPGAVVQADEHDVDVVELIAGNDEDLVDRAEVWAATSKYRIGRAACGWSGRRRGCGCAAESSALGLIAPVPIKQTRS